MKRVLLTATVQSHICQFHRPLVKMLHDNGYEVHVAARDNLSEKNGLKLDFADKVFDVPFARSPKDTKNIQAYKQLKKILKENSYDIVHCNTPMGGIVTRLAAKKYRKSGTTVVYTAHGFHFFKGASKKSWLLFYPVEKLFAHITDKLITINKEDYKLASEKFKTDVYYIHGVGANSEKFKVYSDEERNKLKSELGFCEDDKLILCIGELLKNKNQKTIIEAMPEILKHHSHTRLLIAGNGSELDNLKSLVSELKLEDNVIFLGYCTVLEKYANICDVAVSCSYREGLGLNVIECMLCKKPVVASVNRGHRELVSNGENGFLVPPDDFAAFAQRVTELFENKKLYNDMCEAALAFAQQFTDKAVINELLKIYDLEKKKEQQE